MQCIRARWVERKRRQRDTNLMREYATETTQRKDAKRWCFFTFFFLLLLFQSGNFNSRSKIIKLKSIKNHARFRWEIISYFLLCLVLMWGAGGELWVMAQPVVEMRIMVVGWGLHWPQCRVLLKDWSVRQRVQSLPEEVSQSDWIPIEFGLSGRHASRWTDPIQFKQNSAKLFATDKNDTFKSRIIEMIFFNLDLKLMRIAKAIGFKPKKRNQSGA